MKGVYVYDSEGLLMISSGGEGKFSIEDIIVEDDKIVVTIGDGSKENFIFKVDAKYNNLPIVIKNNTLDIPDSTTESNVIFGMNYANQEAPKSLGIALGGLVKSNTGKLYYEMIDANGNVAKSNTVDLTTTGPYYSRFLNVVDPKEFVIGKMTVKFYEDSTKAKEIHSFEMFIVDDE